MNQYIRPIIANSVWPYTEKCFHKSTTCKMWIQISLDGGTTWIDVVCFAFTTSSDRKVVNLSGLTPVTSLYAPTDGTLGDNTAKDGIMGAAMRAKITSVGTYANTVLSVKINAR